MIKPDREALISFGVLGALLLVCASMVGFSVQARFGAAHELVMRRELLSRLEARSRSDAAQRRSGVAPAAAFVSAPTQGLAGAQLQAYLQHVIGTNHAVLVSSGTDPAKGDSIRLRATFDTNLRSLQALLYQLESGTPYVFVETINIELPAANTHGPVEDPLLRITLALRAVWRRDAA
jgi:general secretion pathway protein M